VSRWPHQTVAQAASSVGCTIDELIAWALERGFGALLGSDSCSDEMLDALVSAEPDEDELLGDVQDPIATLLGSVNGAKSPSLAAKVRGDLDIHGKVVELHFDGGPLLVASDAHARSVLATLAAAPQVQSLSIGGETGCGKELSARLAHAARGRGSFYGLNCAAVNEELSDSELFGHVRGAFTNAQGARDGAFVAARGGTVFLDEIAEFPLVLQAKLLRVLEDRRVRPVGSDIEVALEPTLVVCGTNADLAGRVRNGQFREDLFYRLTAFSVELPPLRERKHEIVPLAQHFLARQGHHHVLGLRAKRALFDYGWPGNIRELRNVVGRAALLADRKIGLAHLGLQLDDGPRPRARHAGGRPSKLDRALVAELRAAGVAVPEIAMAVRGSIASVYRVFAELDRDNVGR
jgi:DNA-binding NtrC family response regulator